MSEIRRKLVMVGDGACGKTSLALLLCTGVVQQVCSPHLTVFENYVADVEVDGKHVELAIWDTGGVDDYDRLRLISYPDTHVVLICFSIDSPDSLDNVQKKASNAHLVHFCPRMPIILVGIKYDLRYHPRTIEELRKTHQRPVTYDEGMEVSRKIRAKHYVECSAKTGEGVHLVFLHATREALRPRPEPSHK
ncbi:hypothetical protein K443DRAFT_54689, partial [Laccaria amethystina LaAM-08-1]